MIVRRILRPSRSLQRRNRRWIPLLTKAAGGAIQTVAPAQINSSATVTATVTRSRAVVPSGINSTASVTASVVRVRPVTPGSISSKATVNGSAGLELTKLIRPYFTIQINPFGQQWDTIASRATVTASVDKSKVIVPSPISSKATVTATTVTFRNIAPSTINSKATVTITLDYLPGVPVASHEANQLALLHVLGLN